MQAKTILLWVLRLVSAYILLQTLGHKFGGSAESRYIFTTVGMEPWGRIGSGVVELIASVLILIPRTTPWGAMLALGTMSGAIFFHLTGLGVEVMGDGGLLFFMALTVWLCSAILLYVYRATVLDTLSRLQNSRKSFS